MEKLNPQDARKFIYFSTWFSPVNRRKIFGNHKCFIKVEIINFHLFSPLKSTNQWTTLAPGIPPIPLSTHCVPELPFRRVKWKHGGGVWCGCNCRWTTGGTKSQNESNNNNSRNGNGWKCKNEKFSGLFFISPKKKKIIKLKTKRWKLARKVSLALKTLFKLWTSHSSFELHFLLLLSPIFSFQ